MSDTETSLVPIDARDTAVMPGFGSEQSWKLANRIGQAFAASSLVPQAYQGNVANCIVALEMANRMGASPLMVMQNLYIVHGNPGWSSKFLIACFNQCGRFSSLRYEWSSDRSECRAWAIEKATGDRIEGPKVSIQMAKDEGWSTKSGSKWKTMPELMLMYRSAAFLIRTYAPEISMGLQTDDEIIDMAPQHQAPAASSIDAVRALAAKKAATAAQVEPPPPVTPTGEISEALAKWLTKIEAAPDAEVAAIVLDDAREDLDAQDTAALVAKFDAKWGQK